jgi:ABC-type multidrug transport system fused ATPase/permease subunit
VIGDGGQGLSGGQRQRIGIARALLTQPRLILFDEATSSLDAKTEKSITETLKKLKGQTTIIVIAHRLTSIEGSDLLLILENGEVRDYGRMTELVRHHPELKSLSESEG